jgi:hypothetical protein
MGNVTTRSWPIYGSRDPASRALETNSRIASSDSKSLNHKIRFSFDRYLALEDSEMVIFQNYRMGSTYAEKGGARSEGGEVSRKEVNVSGCVMSLKESSLGRYECFRCCRSETRR